MYLNHFAHYTIRLPKMHAADVEEIGFVWLCFIGSLAIVLYS